MDFKNLAVQAAKQYGENPKVEAVLLGGSASRNWQDQFSDMELFVFWKQAPADEERHEVIRQLNGKILDFHPFEDEEWSETYVFGDVKFEISNFRTSTIEKIIEDVLVRFDTSPDKQCIAAAIEHGVPLIGEDILAPLKNSVEAYPSELQEAVIREYMDLGNRWHNRKALVHREDWLMFYQMIVNAETHIMAMLFGLNRQFIPHPAFKWQRYSLALMPIKPKNCTERMEGIFFQEPAEALEELESLIEEVYGLIGEELPQIDQSVAIDRSIFQRPHRDTADSGD